MVHLPDVTAYDLMGHLLWINPQVGLLQEQDKKEEDDLEELEEADKEGQEGDLRA